MVYKKYTSHEDLKRLTNRKGCEITYNANASRQKAAEVIAISTIFSLTPPIYVLLLIPSPLFVFNSNLNYFNGLSIKVKIFVLLS